MQIVKLGIAALMCSLFVFGQSNVQAASGEWTEQGVPKSKIVKAKLIKNGPTLIFSDSPEYVYENGIMYRDTISGAGRIFFHHVNATKKLKKLAIVVRNTDLRPNKFSLVRRGVAGPHIDYLAVGKESQLNYFAPQNNLWQKTLGFDESLELLDNGGLLFATDELITGTIDFETDRPVEVSVLMCEPETDAEFFVNFAKILPLDEHPLRGTFKNADWHYEIKTKINTNKQQNYAITLADSESGYARGIDATTGLEAENYGNYGIIYDVSYKLSGDNFVNLWINPWGGMFAGVGLLKEQNKEILREIPNDSLAFGDIGDEGALLGKLKADSSTRFIWSPPGASNLPIRLFWLPIGDKVGSEEIEISK